MLLFIVSLAACSVQRPTQRAFTPFPTVNRQVRPTLVAKATKVPTVTLTPTDLPADEAGKTATAQAAAGLAITPTLPPNPTESIDPLACLPDEARQGNSGEIGLVSWIQDGQTIVMDFQGERRSVRLLGLDSPPFAKRRLETLLENQVARIFRDPNLPFQNAPDGTPYGYVLTADGSFINFEMLRLGEARLDQQLPEFACRAIFQAAEADAKAAVVGIWGVQAANPLPTEASASTKPPDSQPTGTAIALAPTATPTWTPGTPSTPGTATATLAPGVTLSITPNIATQSPSQTTPSPSISAAPTTAVVTTQPAPPPPQSTSTATPSGEGFSDVDVEISNIYWSGNPSRNQSNEYIELHNTGSAAFDLTGWSVYSDIGVDAYFNDGTTLAPGAYCRVYTNELHSDSCGGISNGISFMSGEEVWLDPPDYTGCGSLWTPDEDYVAEYCYE